MESTCCLNMPSMWVLKSHCEQLYMYNMPVLTTLTGSGTVGSRGIRIVFVFDDIFLGFRGWSGNGGYGDPRTGLTRVCFEIATKKKEYFSSRLSSAADTIGVQPSNFRRVENCTQTLLGGCDGPGKTLAGRMALSWWRTDGYFGGNELPPTKSWKKTTKTRIGASARRRNISSRLSQRSRLASQPCIPMPTVHCPSQPGCMSAVHAPTYPTPFSPPPAPLSL
jgi:hypothetical protein